MLSLFLCQGVTILSQILCKQKLPQVKISSMMVPSVKVGGTFEDDCWIQARPSAHSAIAMYGSVSGSESELEETAMAMEMEMETEMEIETATATEDGSVTAMAMEGSLATAMEGSSATATEGGSAMAMATEGGLVTATEGGSVMAAEGGSETATEVSVDSSEGAMVDGPGEDQPVIAAGSVVSGVGGLITENGVEMADRRSSSKSGVLVGGDVFIKG